MAEEGKIVGERPYGHRGRTLRQAQVAPLQTPKKGKSVKFSLIILCFSALIWLGLKIDNPHMMPIRSVQIQGSYTHIDHAVLRQTILPFIQSGFIRIDTTSLQDRLKQLPWMGNVKVARVWPDKVVVTIKELQAVARFNNQAMLNNEGELFSAKSLDLSTNLPLFIASTGQQALMLQNYQKMLGILAPLKLKITILALDARQSWRMQLDNGIVVLLGKVDPLPRLERFVAAYPQVIGSKSAQVNYIDLSYAHGISVSFKNQKVRV